MLTNPGFSKAFWDFSKMDKNKCPKWDFQNTFEIGII
jgi:hypothetical protein